MSTLPLRRSARLVSPPSVSSQNRKVCARVVQHHSEEQVTEDNPRPTKRARKEKASAMPKSSREGRDLEHVDADSTELAQKPRRRKKAETIEPKPEDFPSRVVNPWKVGPHVSSAGGVENAIVNAATVGANAFALFLKSQRKWTSSDLTSQSASLFKDRMKQFGYSAAHILPHGSYLVNLGNPDEEKREKSYQCFLDDLRRCEQLGLHLYNFHPGSTVGQATMDDSLASIASCINRAHKETAHVVIVLENMAGSGNVVGSRFCELGNIIRQVDDKSRVGVCLDTCHMFAAGYEIRTKEGWESTMAEFEREVGLEYLRGMHLNDSKVGLGSKKDRHENIGLGQLGLATFARVLSDPRTRDLPLILETPAFDVPGSSGGLGASGGMDVWKKEVEVLNRLATTGREVRGAGRLEEWAGEIGAAVKVASAARDAKGRKQEGQSKRRTRKKGRQAELGGAGEEDGGACASCDDGDGER
ncbi:hypothetical protein AcW1_006294 [Taiwanofungus camphoratus]|nr:hypothetical protein AcW2_005048 [Antrodia cinnamomea]KAI0934925.1 hypothetical protein AcV5_006613 [Antrodia cinnamomea]KAI0958121.1 hypothetical protein AcW1_006294 [Antrodia cinnamomea]